MAFWIRFFLALLVTLVALKGDIGLYVLVFLGAFSIIKVTYGASK